MKYVAVLNVDNDIVIHGDTCCTSLRDLYQALANTNTTEIEITKDFANEFFTYSALCDFVEYSASIAPHIRIVVDDTVYDTSAEMVKNITMMRDADELIYVLEHDKSRVMATIDMLCKSYVNAHDESTVANNKIATLMVQMEEMRKRYSYLESDYNALSEAKNAVDAKLSALVSRINFRYDRTVNPDEMFISKKNNYNHILYIKEITRVHYVDTLLYYLSEVLKTMYGVPVRTVVIEPYYAYGRKSLYPNLKAHWDLTYKDVFANDIFMAGYQPKLMNDILQNPNHVNYLLVLDRAGYSYPHIDCSNTSVVYTATDLKDVDDSISKRDIISYSEETMFIPYIEKFDSLSTESKIQKYSSMSVTKELIKYLEEVQ